MRISYTPSHHVSLSRKLKFEMGEFFLPLDTHANLNIQCSMLRCGQDKGFDKQPVKQTTDSEYCSFSFSVPGWDT